VAHGVQLSAPFTPASNMGQGAHASDQRLFCAGTPKRLAPCTCASTEPHATAPDKYPSYPAIQTVCFFQCRTIAPETWAKGWDGSSGCIRRPPTPSRLSCCSSDQIHCSNMAHHGNRRQNATKKCASRSAFAASPGSLGPAAPLGLKEAIQEQGGTIVL